MLALSLNIKQFYLTLSGATTPGQSGPGSDGNEEVLRIPKSPSVTGASPLDCWVSDQEYSWRGLTPVQRCSRGIWQPYPTGLSGEGIRFIERSCLRFHVVVSSFFFHTILLNTNIFIRFISSIDCTITDTTSWNKSGSGNINKEEVFHTSQISKTGGSLSNATDSLTHRYHFFWRALPFYMRVNVFKALSTGRFVVLSGGSQTTVKLDIRNLGQLINQTMKTCKFPTKSIGRQKHFFNTQCRFDYWENSEKGVRFIT